MARQKRDRAYFLKRLQQEHPAIHAAYLSGKFESVRAASLAAGLIKGRTSLQVLLNAWSKASRSEQDDFLAQAGLARTSTAGPLPATSTRPVFTSDNKLTHSFANWLEAHIDAGGMTTGDVTWALGFNRSNASLGNATGRSRSRINDPKFRAALEAYARRNGW